MSTSPNLPVGAFITTLGGRRCTALPRTDVNTQTSTTSTFSTSLISTISAAQVAPQVVPAPAVQNTVEQTTPAPVTATTSASTGQVPIITTSSTPEPAFSTAAAASQPQSSVADTSSTALSTAPLTTPSVAAATTPLVGPSVAVPTAATTASTSPAAQVAPAPAQSEVVESDTAAPFTTLGASPSTVISSQPTGSTGLVAAGNGSSGSNGNGSTLAVAGGVIGGVALVSLVAFLIWFWRRRQARKRDTLLTPLSASPSFGRDLRDEQRPYLMDRDSIGPTPRSTKVKAALRAQYGRVRGRFETLARSSSVRSHASHSTTRSVVNMNRGNSQFMDTSPIVGHERKNSSALSAQDDSDVSIKERIMELWARFTGSGKQDLAGDEKNDIFAARGITGSMREKVGASSRPLTNKPDFLTLLNMDDGELDREAQRRRLSRTRGGSEGSGIGGLNLDFGVNPFSDANAFTSTQSRNGPPVASGANNPFSDANAIDLRPKPSTYVDTIRHSRASTVDLDKAYGLRDLRIVNGDSRPPSNVLGVPRQKSTFLRDSQASAASFETFATKRDKFRSDPFDLEQLSSQVSGSIPNYTPRPGFNSSSNFSTGATRLSSGSISLQYQQSVGSIGPGILVRPPKARLLSESSSQYTSGFSQGTLDEWSEPGPDVGPAATRWDASRRSSAADAYNPYPHGNSSEDTSRRNSKSGSVKMGYAL